MRSPDRKITKMVYRGEIPPTAGLAMCWRDWLPTSGDFSQRMAVLAKLPPLLLECSGTAAFIIALETLKTLEKRGQRQEIIVPAFNCPLVIRAIVACGLKPILCDSQRQSFDFDPGQLAKLISPQTLAIVPTHIGGQIADVDHCLALAHANGAYVIEDGAQAFGAKIGKMGDIAFFSLAVGKGLTLYEGGFVTSHSQKMRQALALTHKKHIVKRRILEFKRLIQLAAYTTGYRPLPLKLIYGLPRRYYLTRGQLEQAVGDYFSENIPVHEVSNFRALRGYQASARLEQFWRVTRSQAEIRIRQLRLCDERITVVTQGEHSSCVWPFLMILLPSQQACDRALAKLWRMPFGVTKLFIHALNDYDYLKNALGKQSATANARDLAARMLTISNSLWLSDEQFTSICRTLKEAL